MKIKMFNHILFKKIILNKYLRIFIYIPIVIIFLLMFIFLKNPTLPINQKVNLNTSADPIKLKQFVTNLSTSYQFRNSDNLTKLNQSADYIFNELTNIGLKPIWQTFLAKGIEYKNIIVKLGPQTNKASIVIGAHYDVCYETPGADDNASGVAGVLELARLLKKNTEKLNRPVELVFYSLEEPPFFGSKTMGSYIHAESKHQKNEKIDLMLSVEMIGYYEDSFFSQDYPSYLMYLIYPTKASFIALVGRLKDWKLTRKIKPFLQNQSDIDIRSINAPVRLAGIDYSDHLNYWKFGYPALMLTDTSFYRNKNYHKLSDTPDTLNYEMMSFVVNQIAKLVIKF